MKIIVKTKKVYGKRLIYPVCDNAYIFAAIAGTKTISDVNIARIRMLGIDVKLEEQSLSDIN